MKFCTVIWDPKSKIEFVLNNNLITSSLILPQFLKKFALRLMGTLKRYNSVTVKDNCALFASTFLFSGPGYPTVSFKFLLCRPPLLWQQILGQNWL